MTQGADDLVTLTARLSARRVHKRRSAARRLAVHPSPEADAALLTALSDEDPGVRWAAVYGLFERNPNRSVEPIIAGLTRGAPDLSVAACRIVALALPVDILRRLLSLDHLRAGVGAPDASCRAICLRLLAATSHSTRLTYLSRASEDPDPGVRATAARCLSEIRDPEAAEILTRLRSDKSLAVRRASRRHR